LLEALSKKAKGWLWTEGLAHAATVAIDLLLAMPDVLPDQAQAEDASSESELSNLDDGEQNPSASESVPPHQDKSAIERNAEFDALDILLGALEMEGRLVAQPLVSDPGLRVCRLKAGVVSVKSMAERRCIVHSLPKHGRFD